MTDVEKIRGLLTTVEAEPTLLPALPPDTWRRGCEETLRRRLVDEVHLCLGCGRRAVVAFLVQQSRERTWRVLDACTDCATAIVTVSEGEGDEHFR